jgi:hypothetical protein
MRKEICDSFDKIRDIVYATIEEKTSERQSVLIIGVGNTVGVAQ